MTCRIFVSHSSKTPAASKRMLQIVRGLRAMGHDPLVDRDDRDRIPPDAEWDRLLEEWLLECHVAVILFSAAALRSGWVQKEAAILCLRRRREPGFKLFGVLLDGVTVEQLDEHPVFRALRITDRQFIRGCTTAEEALDRLRPHVEGLGPVATPLDDLQRRIRDLLATVGDEQTLVDAWNALPGDRKPPGPPRFSFAEAFARYLLREPARAQVHLHAALVQLIHVVGKHHARQLHRLVKGLWVDASAARELATASERSVAVALNGRYTHKFTGQAYAERAWPLPAAFEWVRVPAGDWQPRRIAEAIAAHFARPDDEDETDLVDRFEACKEPIVVVLRSREGAQLPSRGLLERVRREFERRYAADASKLTPLVCVGPELPDDLQADAGPAGAVQPLLPALDLEVEAAQWQAYADVERLVDVRAPG